MGQVLDRVGGPGDIKVLSEEDLAGLSADVREMIMDTVSRTGGHLAANLGVVELTVALLRVFSPPKDKILWDVSHQTYAYKILTDRKAVFHTLRQHGGIAGFLKRDESAYDAFGAGHAGTALSAALGMAVARDRRGGDEHIVAVVGDAAAGCGITFEALNNLAGATSRLIVVLNDNEMSIAGNVGSFSKYFGRLLANPRYNRWKASVESAASRLGMGLFRSLYYRTEEAIKSLFLDNVIFEEFGLRYVGPINGHNVHALVDALATARESPRPILLHVSTQKGKGYSFAEEQPEKWHGTVGFDVSSGEPLAAVGAESYSAVAGRALVRLAEKDARIVAITAGMCKGTGLAEFARRFPDRFFDVGISEEHAVVFAAGMATQGFVPVFAVYSTFLQRVVDYIIHDVCLQRLPVVFCVDRAGVVGDDGPTHHGVFDVALLRPVPDLVLMQPKDERELGDMLFTATRLGKPVAIRYPRGAGTGASLREDFADVPIGMAEPLRRGTDVQVWALGDRVPDALKVADLLAGRGLSAGVWNARFAKPLDRVALTGPGRAGKLVVTMENGVLCGGFGAGVEDCLSECGCRIPVLKFGWPDHFVPHGDSAVLMRDAGLTPERMAERILARMESHGEGSGDAKGLPGLKPVLGCGSQGRSLAP